MFVKKSKKKIKFIFFFRKMIKKNLIKKGLICIGLMELYNINKKRQINLNNLSYIPGSIIDELYITDMNNNLKKIYSKIIFLSLFPITAPINLFTNFIIYNYYNIINDEYNAKVHRILMIKHLLGLISFPFSIYYTKEFSNWFVAPLKVIDDIIKVNSKEEIVKLVKNNKKLIVVGEGYSQGEHHNTLGMKISLKNLNKMKIKDNKLIVEAGATFEEIDKFLSLNGKCLKVRQASNIFSVGGSLSTNVHGWSHKYGSIVNTVDNIKIINENGEILSIDKNNKLFGKIIGSYGINGIIIEATFDLIDNNMLIQEGVPLHISDYKDFYNKNKNNFDMHLFRLSLQKESLLEEGVAVNYKKINDNIVCVDTNPEFKYGSVKEKIGLGLLRRFDFFIDMYWKNEVKKSLENKIMSTIEHMQPNIKFLTNNCLISETEWLQEYFIPEENIEPFITEIKQLLLENEVVLLNASIRPVIKDNITELKYANKDSFSLVLCFNQHLDKKSILKTRKWIKKAIDITIKYEGKYYLPYQPFATIEQFKKCYSTDSINFESTKSTKSTKFESNFIKKYFNTEIDNIFIPFFKDNLLKKEFENFINVVLMDISPEKFNNTIDDILSYCDNFDDIYIQLQERMSEYKLSKFNELKSLTCLKNDLIEQLIQHLSQDSNKSINGILEIGYPGRFIKSIQKIYDVKGPIDTLYTPNSSKLNDIIESETLLGYKRYILDYSQEIDPNITSKYELITCFVGLHHFKDPEKFVKLISESLKYGGKFILIDHDVTDDKSLKMANMAHTIFNITKNVDLNDEKNEIRNFKSIEEWSKLLSKYGLEIQSKKFVRNNDPSLNTMVCFTKKNIDSLEYSKEFGTFMTTIEWRNVDMALEYSKFLKNGNSINSYPYISQLIQFWKIYYYSFKEANKYSSFSFFSGFNIMNLFILTTTSIELLYKKILTCFLITKTKNNTKFQNYVSNLYLDYANFIPNTPFYFYNFNEKIIPLISNFISNCETFTDLITFLTTLFDLSIKTLPTYPIRKYFSYIDIKRHIIVELSLKENKNEEKLIDFINENKLNYSVNGNYFIKFPKYIEFNNLIKKLPQSVEIKSIGGQTYIQVDIKEQKNKPINEIEFLYSYNNSIDNYEIDIYKVHVSKILDIINKYDVKFIHDF